jgi:hypothetical protein
LMKTLFEKATFFLSSADSLTCIACGHLIFRAVDVFSALWRRRLRTSNRRFLICRKNSQSTRCVCVSSCAVYKIFADVSCAIEWAAHVFLSREFASISS